MNKQEQRALKVQKKFVRLADLSLLAYRSSLRAQNYYGVFKDHEGNPLPAYFVTGLQQNFLANIRTLAEATENDKDDVSNFYRDNYNKINGYMSKNGQRPGLTQPLLDADPSTGLYWNLYEALSKIRACYNNSVVVMKLFMALQQIKELTGYPILGKIVDAIEAGFNKNNIDVFDEDGTARISLISEEDFNKALDDAFNDVMPLLDKLEDDLCQQIDANNKTISNPFQLIYSRYEFCQLQIRDFMRQTMDESEYDKIVVGTKSSLMQGDSFYPENRKTEDIQDQVDQLEQLDDNKQPFATLVISLNTIFDSEVMLKLQNPYAEITLNDIASLQKIIKDELEKINSVISEIGEDESFKNFGFGLIVQTIEDWQQQLDVMRKNFLYAQNLLFPIIDKGKDEKIEEKEITLEEKEIEIEPDQETEDLSLPVRNLLQLEGCTKEQITDLKQAHKIRADRHFDQTDKIVKYVDQENVVVDYDHATENLAILRYQGEFDRLYDLGWNYTVKKDNFQKILNDMPALQNNPLSGIGKDILANIQALVKLDNDRTYQLSLNNLLHYSGLLLRDPTDVTLLGQYRDVINQLVSLYVKGDKKLNKSENEIASLGYINELISSATELYKHVSDNYRLFAKQELNPVFVQNVKGFLSNEGLEKRGYGWHYENGCCTLKIDDELKYSDLTGHTSNETMVKNDVPRSSFYVVKNGKATLYRDSSEMLKALGKHKDTVVRYFIRQGIFECKYHMRGALFPHDILEDYDTERILSFILGSSSAYFYVDEGSDDIIIKSHSSGMCLTRIDDQENLYEISGTYSLTYRLSEKDGLQILHVGASNSVFENLLRNPDSLTLDTDLSEWSARAASEELQNSVQSIELLQYFQDQPELSLHDLELLRKDTALLIEDINQMESKNSIKIELFTALHLVIEQRQPPKFNLLDRYYSEIVQQLPEGSDLRKRWELNRLNREIARLRILADDSSFLGGQGKVVDDFLDSVKEEAKEDKPDFKLLTELVQTAGSLLTEHADQEKFTKSLKQMFILANKVQGHPRLWKKIGGYLSLIIGIGLFVAGLALLGTGNPLGLFFMYVGIGGLNGGLAVGAGLLSTNLPKKTSEKAHSYHKFAKDIGFSKKDEIEEDMPEEPLGIDPDLGVKTEGLDSHSDSHPNSFFTEKPRVKLEFSSESDEKELVFGKEKVPNKNLNTDIHTPLLGNNGDNNSD